MPRPAKTAKKDSTANLGFEAKLWLAADKLRNNMDAAEYKHVVLGLIFLKYISDSFDEHHAKLVAGEGDYEGAYPEDKDEYLAANVFWVPKEARWAQLQSRAKLPSIGKDVDDAMVALERDNPRLKGALNKSYGRADLDKHRLGELIDLIGSIQLTDVASRSKDLLGRVFEYFLTQFASAEGKNGGQFYTPSCVVRCLVEMLAPYKGRIYDPCCGSGGMFVQSEKFVEAHGGRLGDISIYGQESNPTTRRLAVMNLALRGIEADFGPEHADSFRRDLHPDLRADYVLANPPFNDSDWHRKDDDVRWQYGVPPKGNANFAWVQHFIHHLSPRSPSGGGMAGFVLANGSMSSNQSGEGEIRRRTRRGRPGGLHGRPARPALLQHPDPRLPLVPREEQTGRQTARPPRPDTLHRRPQARHPHRPRPPRADRRRSGQDRLHLPRLARRPHGSLSPRGRGPGRGGIPLRRHPRFLQIRHHRRDRGAWLCPHPRPLCRRRGSRRRRGAVRGENGSPGGGPGGAVCRLRKARNRDTHQPGKTKVDIMSKERFIERQTDVRASSARLAEAVAQPESDLIRDATIQRFEFTFEVVWKALKLYLERQGHECGGPRPTLKKAFAENLIPTPEEADRWFQMLEDRNSTSHAYDEDLARAIYGRIVADHAPLLAVMAERIEALSWD